MARIKLECSFTQELGYSTRVRLKVIDDPAATTETELAHVGSITIDITNPAPPVDFVKGQFYYAELVPVED